MPDDVTSQLLIAQWSHCSVDS